MLFRVLGRDDHEGRFQPMRVPVERDLAVVHGFEQRALRARGSAVDLVSQDHIGEERAWAKDELA